MSKRVLVLSAAVVLAAVAPRAEAQFVPRVYCPPGQPSCFAAAFNYNNYVGGLPGHPFLDGVTLTVMSVYVQNLQGSYNWSGATDPFQVNTLGFFRKNDGFDNLSNSLFVNLLPTTNSPPRSGSTVGAARTGQAPFLSESASADPINDLSTTYYTDVSGGVMGCNLGEYASPFRGWGWQTCPSSGLNGWVKFDFALYWAEQVGAPRFVTGDDFFLTMGAANTGSDYLCGFGQEIGIDVPVDACPDQAYQWAVVTPEPTSIILLASGLAGVGGVGALRRRRRRA